jgi:hypothetical protein
VLDELFELENATQVDESPGAGGSVPPAPTDQESERQEPRKTGGAQG